LRIVAARDIHVLTCGVESSKIQPVKDAPMSRKVTIPAMRMTLHVGNRRQDARRTGNEEGGEACAPLIPTCLRAFIFATSRRRDGLRRDVLSAGDVFVPKTVVLELEWVLRYVADQAEDKVIECLAHLIALPGVTVEDRDEIDTALGHCRNGIDFADALHLAASKACTELLTFDDRGYARRARKLRLKPPVRVPHG
jgi:predicted nucleic-acid-binding protein